MFWDQLVGAYKNHNIWQATVKSQIHIHYGKQWMAHGTTILQA